MDARERGAYSEAAAAAIRAERAVRGWTLEEAAAAADMPRSTYRRVEKGERVADVQQLGKIAAAFGMSLVEFFAQVEHRMS